MRGFQRSNQDGGRLPLRFRHHVQQAVDPVGEVDVGVAWGAEEDPGALGQADVGVARGVVGLIALGLDDGAAAAFVEEGAADQVAGDLVDRALEKAAVESLLGGSRQERSSWTRACTAASVCRASSSCFASATELVPPAIRFDSSQLLRCKTS